VLNQGATSIYSTDADPPVSAASKFVGRTVMSFILSFDLTKEKAFPA